MPKLPMPDTFRKIAVWNTATLTVPANGHKTHV